MKESTLLLEKEGRTETNKLINFFSKLAIVLGMLGMVIFTLSLIAQFYLPIESLQVDKSLMTKIKLLTFFYLAISILLFYSGKGISKLNNKSRLLLIVCSYILLIWCLILLFIYIVPLIKMSGLITRGLFKFILVLVYAIANILVFSRKDVKSAFK